MVLVPQLGIPEDGQALQQISEAMPRCKVIGIPAMEAVRNGGALNCISWNVATRQWTNGFMGEEYRVHGRPISWIKKEAKEGRANWQCNLGVCYFYGEGVEKTCLRPPNGTKKRPNRVRQKHSSIWDWGIITEKGCHKIMPKRYIGLAKHRSKAMPTHNSISLGVLKKHRLHIMILLLLTEGRQKWGTQMLSAI